MKYYLKLQNENIHLLYLDDVSLELFTSFRGII